MNNNQTFIEFSAAKYSVIEKDQPFPNELEITITRSGDTNNSDSVELHLGNTTAQQGLDFDGIFPQSVDFEPGQTEKKVYINISDDFELEGTENIELKLIGNPAILGQQDTTTISLLDNETSYIEFASPKYITYEEDNTTFNKLEVTVTRSGNINTSNGLPLEIILGTADYSDFMVNNTWVDFNYGETSKVIEIEVPDDWNFEGTESFQLQLIDEPNIQDEIELGENATTTVEIRDRQTSYFEFGETKYITYEEDDTIFNKLEVTVTRSGNIETSNGIPLDIILGTADYSDFIVNNTSVSFNNGETSKVIEIEVPNDGIFEGTENFQLQLWDDPSYPDDIELGENATTTVEIRDRQTSYFEFGETKYITYEEDDTIFNKLEVTVTRSGNIETSNGIPLDIILGTADYSDFIVNNTSVSFNNGETSKVIEIEVPNDGSFSKSLGGLAES
ncbi:Calx-beta domain-containing protein [Crocosphaera sp. Alani8]|uniref:Calx-beta domain-containing protein n=1 Tax=Crocosphaera sp. Alani8 TaxID=3038952 RepID=UPI00313C828F